MLGFQKAELVFSMYAFVEESQRCGMQVNHRDWWHDEQRRYRELLWNELKIKGWWKRMLIYCFSDIEGERYILNYIKYFCNVPLQPALPKRYEESIRIIENFYARVQPEASVQEVVKA